MRPVMEHVTACNKPGDRLQLGHEQLAFRPQLKL